MPASRGLLERLDESSKVCGFRGVHSLDELSAPRCKLVPCSNRRSKTRLLGDQPHLERLVDTVRVRGTHSGLALMQMDLDPRLHRGCQPVDRFEA